MFIVCLQMSQLSFEIIVHYDNYTSTQYATSMEPRYETWTLNDVIKIQTRARWCHARVPVQLEALIVVKSWL